MAITTGPEIEMKDHFYVDKNGYVYKSVSKFNKELKRTKPEKVYLGKKSDKLGMFYPNGKYFSLYPEEIKREDPPTQSSSIAYGTYAVLNKIIADTGLYESLLYSFLPGDSEATEEASPEVKEWTNLLIDIAFYMIKDESGDMLHFPEYCYRNAILSGRIFSDSEISRFFKERVSRFVREKFLSKWSDRHPLEGRAFVCYDSTNFNSVSEGITFVEKGYAKGDRNKPQFNLECVVRSKDGLPLVYDQFPGSVIDVRQCRKMIDTVKSLGYKNITFVCDRGYISEENIRIMLENGYSFVLMVKDNLVIKKDIVTDRGNEVRENCDCYYKDLDIYGKTYKDRIYGNIDVYHHLFYTSDITREDRQYFYQSIDDKESELKEMLEKKISQPKKQIEAQYGRFFDIVYGKGQDEKLIVKDFRRNSDKINGEYKKLSFYSIITDRDLDVPTVMEQYRLRDRVEKSFMFIKTNLRLKSFGTHSNETTESKIFACFLSSIIRSVLVEKTRMLRQTKKDSKSYTVSAALGELSKIEAVKSFAEGKRIIRFVLTNKQRAILNAFNVDSDYLTKLLSKYALG